MTDVPLAVNDIWKSFGKIQAVCGLSLTVPFGSVYGFLGPNGAGKSTTIRMILGLQRPNRGTIALFGQPMGRHGTAVLRRVGSLVEAPSLYLHLTGRENLEVHRLLLDCRRRGIDDVLDTVGLLPAADRIVRGYSSGMKQRLGLAQALLGDPELLLLDEPTNALDPAGIHEVRNLLRELPKRRPVTVFLSSHLLAEVEQTATHVAIISSGQLKFEGDTAGLLARSQRSIIVEVDLPDRAVTLLSDHGLSASRDGNRLRIRMREYPRPAQINKLLVDAGIGVAQLVTEYSTLEDIFLELTNSKVAQRA
jgi:lantibiotic transport system ATP-binding protein